ncbi:hypothetical protein HYV70_04780, partial [Candidatus Uhrbacteria bacterium]|nr:hypothetical protein [Candidatus Uhrbacteria bacterium]
MLHTWRKFSAFVFLITILLGGVAATQAAAPPNIVTYQGRVLNTNGVPVSDSSISMKFALYNSLAGGTCVWSNDSSTCFGNTPGSIVARSVTLTSGLFTENLGDTTNSYAAIPDTVFADNSGVYLEVIIAGETLSPRRRLTAAPYALNAQRLDGIDSTGFLASDGDTATGDYDLSGAELVGASPIVFEGSSNDGNTTTFAFTDPTADRTITFQNSSGTVAFTSDITSSQWETGINGIFEDDAAIIIGADTAFTYATGGVGDVRLADELEVMGDGFIDNDLVIGASTSSTETLSHISFSLGGDDLFVAGTLGVEGVVYSDGGFTASTDTTFGSGIITTTGTTDLLLTIAGGDLAFAQATTIGDGGDALVVNTSDWDISATGDLTNIGTVTMNGLLTGTSGAALSGASVSFNENSNFNTSINTGTSNGVVSIGGGSASIVVDSTSWDVTASGSINLNNSADVVGLVVAPSIATTTAVDLSDTDIVTALSVGANDIVGTTGLINYTNFDVDGSGNAIIGGTLGTTGIATFSANTNANGGVDVDDAFVVADGGVLTTSQTANFDGTVDFDSLIDATAGVVQGASPLVFEGLTANDFESTFAFTDPTADNTITFQNGSGTIAFLSDIGGGSLFTDGGTVTYLTSTTDDLAIGGTTLAAPFSVDVETNILRVGDATNDTNDPTITFYASDAVDSGSISFVDADDFLFTGGDLTFAQNTIIGDGGDTLAIDTSDWDISAMGDMTGIGSITSNGAIVTTSTFDVDGAANIADTTAGADVTMGNSTGNLTFLSDNADFTLTDATDNVFQLVNAT